MKAVLISVLLLLALATPVSAFSLSPIKADLTINGNSSSQAEFTVRGYEGILDIGLEGLDGFEVSPSSKFVKDGDKVTLDIINVSASAGEYSGKITFLATSINRGYKLQANIEVVKTANILTIVLTIIMVVLFGFVLIMINRHFNKKEAK